MLDHYVGDVIPHALEDKGEVAEQYVSMFYFEVIIRRLLTMRKPDAPAVRARFAYCSKNVHSSLIHLKDRHVQRRLQ